MKKKFIWRISLIAAATILSILFFLPLHLWSRPARLVKEIRDNTGSGPSGGVHLVYEVDIDKTVDVTVERIASSLTNTFKEKKIVAKAEKQGWILSYLRQ